MARWLALAGGIMLIDQITKFAVLRNFTIDKVVEVMPFFNLVLVYNRGAAFSFLSNAAGWQRELFIAIALVASAWIIFLLRRYRQQTLFCLALSLVLAGALGNVIDRILFGAVVDFLDFHAYGYHWPAFNVADSAITCGAALLVWDGFRPRKTKIPELPINADKRR
ncbi:MAG TPA: signal peptidase II [Burkholderiales bacterium]|nr:signal peptidase II [Burkholderiales bacterium]